MLVAGLDFETTGVDVAKDDIIEVGAVLWDTERAAPLRIMSVLVNPCIESEGPPELSTEIQELTGILPADLEKYGVSTGNACTALSKLCKDAEWIVAHNGLDFDRPMLVNACNPESRPHLFGEMFPQPWIDTMMDIPLKPRIVKSSLSLLAAQHGFLNPFEHRAVFDVMTMLKLAQHYSWDEIVARAKTPAVRVIAQVPFEQKDLAKASKFYWDPNRRVWTKVMRQGVIESLNLPFKWTTEEFHGGAPR